MRFESPGFLLLVVVAVVAGVAVLVAEQRARRRSADRFASPELQPSLGEPRASSRRLVTSAGLVVVVMLLLIGAAQPSRAVEEPFDLSSVIVSLDISRSMSARDVPPTRLDAAKSAAREFVRALPENLLVGYVTFTDQATVEVAPTDDRAQVLARIAGTRLGTGTAIGEGIFSALDAITTSLGIPPPPAESERYQDLTGSAVVLLSDGQTTSGRPNQRATRAAARANVPVSTIAFGTLSGTIGQGETVPVDTEALQSIAEQTGGRYFEATSVKELAEVYSTLESRIGHRRVYRDITIWFAVAALVAAIVTAILSLWWFSRVP